MRIVPSNLRIPVALVFSLIGVLFACLGISPAATNSSQPLVSKSQVPVVLRPDAQTGFTSNALSDVECVSTSDCWAVGAYNYALIEHWDGSSWSIVPSAAGIKLNNVECIGTSDCWAVGAGLLATTLIEHWDGTSWSRFDFSDATQGRRDLLGLACASSSDCWAVGDVYVNQLPQTLAKHWDGTSWSTVATPNTSSAEDNRLLSVACPSTADCWAVGFTQGATLIEHWNGTSWSIVNSPNMGPPLNDVVCVSASNCWAVGGSTIERWDGMSWTVVNSPALGPKAGLFGVTCASALDCWAVGDAGPTDPFFEHWNGSSWAIVAAAPTVNGYSTVAFRVSCESTSSCWGAGGQFAQHWNGTNWMAFPMAPAFSGAKSRMMHGNLGPFDTGLPFTECRRGGPNGSYQLIFTFGRTLTNVDGALTSVGAVSSHSFGPDSNQYTVSLANISPNQSVDVTLKNVHDEAGNFGDVSMRMTLLLGDIIGDGHVNASDVGQTKTRVGQPASAENCRSDVNLSGSINASDVAIVKANVGSGAP